MHLLLKSLALLSAAMTIAGLGYLCLCLLGIFAYLRKSRQTVVGTFTPPVSILKPLRGTDPEMYESFRSHCLQEYPEYEIIFGVTDAADPAVIEVRRLMEEFPESRIQLLVLPEILGPNVKVSNLMQMVRAARFDYLVVNDSDIRVSRDYLRRVIAPLAAEKIGMVTCLYRGVAAQTLGSRLESVGTSTDFCPAVLSARLLQGVRFGLGSTLAMSRRALEAIGGFEPLLEYLADDYEVGARIAKVGYEVVVSEAVVEHFQPGYTMREYLDHQLRWARAIRDSRRWDYVGLGITFPLVWSVLALAFSGGAGWAWALLVITAAMRIVVAIAAGKSVLRDPQLFRDLWLIPLRDVLALGVWVASFTGHKILWRGVEFRLKDGKLRPA